MKIFPQNSLVAKAVLLFCFALILLIPLKFIFNIISERSDLYDYTSSGIGQEWGSSQVIAGPVIVVPYSVRTKQDETITDENGKKRIVSKTVVNNYRAVILPDTMNASIDLADEVRRRGIYQSTVYTAKLSMKGKFDINLRQTIGVNGSVTINLNDAFVSLGVKDTKAIMKISSFKVGSQNIDLQSGSGLESIEEFKKGTFGNVDIKTADNISLPYDIAMEFRGSNGISVIPVAKINDVAISSSWKDPSFFGLLPEKRDISGEGFKASWNVSHLVRNYSQAFVDGRYGNLDEAVIGVTLYDTVTHYRQVIRAVKYGFLFIVLTLLTLFIFEVTSRRQAHFIQYAIVGASLVMFYLLLLSLSEHISFFLSYLVSTAAVVLPVSLYTAGIMGDKRYGGVILLILTGLYLILFSILKMEDYALITGTILVMCVIYALMYLTRNLRDFTDEATPSSPEDKDEGGNR